MGNIELRLKVAKALGWMFLEECHTPFAWRDADGWYKDDKRVGHLHWDPTMSYYEALDALREFCQNHECQWEIQDLKFSVVAGGDRYQCRIAGKRCLTTYVSHSDLATAICLCIKQAAESVGMR